MGAAINRNSGGEAHVGISGCDDEDQHEDQEIHKVIIQSTVWPDMRRPPPAPQPKEVKQRMCGTMGTEKTKHHDDEVEGPPSVGTITSTICMGMRRKKWMKMQRSGNKVEAKN